MTSWDKLKKTVYPSGETMSRKAYPSDVSDDEWAFVVAYLSLMREEAPQRQYSLREVFNGLRYMVRSGGTWRMLPHHLPPREAGYQQTHRWIKAGGFWVIVDHVPYVLRLRDAP